MLTGNATGRTYICTLHSKALVAPEDIRLSDASQIRDDKYYMLALLNMDHTMEEDASPYMHWLKINVPGILFIQRNVPKIYIWQSITCLNRQ